MKTLKIAKIHATSTVQWDCESGVREGKVRQIMGTHASVIDSSGTIYVIEMKKIRKKINGI